MCLYNSICCTTNERLLFINVQHVFRKRLYRTVTRQSSSSCVRLKLSVLSYILYVQLEAAIYQRAVRVWKTALYHGRSSFLICLRQDVDVYCNSMVNFLVVRDAECNVMWVYMYLKKDVLIFQILIQPRHPGFLLAEIQPPGTWRAEDPSAQSLLLCSCIAA